MRQPLASWPGTRLRVRDVYVPEDAQGDLWGPRDHGVLHVDARWPDQQRPLLPASVRWRRTSVGALCDRLPDGATTTVRRTGLDDPPRAVDLGDRLRDVGVARLDDEAAFAALARHQGALAAYRLHDPREHAVLLLAVAQEGFERSRRDFADDCALARIPEPAALWAQDDLPRRVRKLLASG